MKNQIKILLCVWFLIYSWTAHATHEMGGDFEYDLIDSVNRIYRLRLVLYRDCSGIPMQTQVQMKISYSRGLPDTSYTVPAKLQPPSNLLGVEVTPLCNPKPLTTCSSSGSPIKGTQRYVYETIVQFPIEGGVATISYSSCCRNVNTGMGSITSLSPTSSTLMGLEAQINTEAKNGNTSAKFMSSPIQYICAGTLFKYNFFAIDSDGDSLVYSFHAPYVPANQVSVIYMPPLSAKKTTSNGAKGNFVGSKNGTI